jgi:AraC family ethanolamine operon transcriptional activator
VNPDSLECAGFRRSFSLFDEMAANARWYDTDFRQLSPSEGEFWLEQLATPRMLYMRVGLGSHFHQLGASPPGYRTFALLADRSRDFRWCGEYVDRASLIVMPESGEFESVSPPGFELMSLSLANDLLQQVARDRFGCDLSRLLGPERVFCPRAGSAVSTLRQLLDRLAHPWVRAMPAQEVCEQESRLAFLALSCLELGNSKAPRGPRSKRMRILAEALACLDTLPVGRVAVPELVCRLGVSRRTLEHAFRDGLDVSPAAYIKALRLQALSRDLLAAKTGSVTVSELMAEHGFDHPGQLAADYHQLYGELPSATLRREREAIFAQI